MANPTSHLNLEPNLWHPDDFYAALMAAHRDLDERQSRLLNARLVLLLANHIGDREVLIEALRLAHEDLA